MAPGRYLNPFMVNPFKRKGFFLCADFGDTHQQLISNPTLICLCITYVSY